MKQNSSIMFHSNREPLTNRYVPVSQRLFTPCVKSAVVISLLLQICLFSSGCDTPEGSRNAATAAGAGAGALAGFFAGGRRNGPAGAIFGAFAGATLARRYAPGLFSSRKLKFQEAVLRGDSETVSRLANSQYVDARIKGFPPIYYASIRGDTETVSVLARYGASMRYRYDGHSLAYIAAENGHLQTAEALVRYDGGTSADVSGGRALYATNIQEQKKEAAACCATALLFLDAELKSSASSNSEDNEHNYDNSGLSRDEYQEYLNNISDH